MELKDGGTWVKEYRGVTIRTTDGSTFAGKINLSHNKRVSDLFKSPSEQFIVLIDVINRECPEKVVIINKNQIVWVEPCE